MNENRNITDNNIKKFIKCYNPRNSEKYKIYGPSNPSSEYCQYSDDGNCYMLTCLCKEVDEDGIELGDYYNGECEICKEKLPNKKYVWRTPLLEGGFIGCYCRQHFRLFAKEDEDEDEDNEFSNLCDIMEIVRDTHQIETYELFSELTSELTSELFSELTSENYF